MGVRGLTTFIADNSSLYLSPFELNDSFLVVDGNSLGFQLYLNTKSDSLFGGDYDEYYAVVKDFFRSLEKCNVTPIVVIDGGYERKKIKTVKSRIRQIMQSLMAINNGTCCRKFFPLFRHTTFIEVLDDLNQIYLQVDFEADHEIAKIARALKCPVLSYDSDFYVYDVLYIPFPTVGLKPVGTKTNDGKTKYFIQCQIFNVNKLLSQFEGLDKSLLPILATLLGNDYVSDSVFHNFFDHVIMSQSSKKSYTQRKILGVFHWLKKENYDSAVEGILKHVKKSVRPKIVAAINFTQKNYATESVSVDTYKILCRLLETTNNSTHCQSLAIQESNLKLPPLIQKLLAECKISKFIIDLLTLGIYFTSVQIEDLSKTSAHIHSIPLIKAIMSLIHKFCFAKEDSFKLYLVHKHKYLAFEVQNNFTDYMRDIDLHEILNKSQESRLKVLFHLIDFDEDDIQMISKFNGPWSLYLTACLYWIKCQGESISFTHICALLLMAIANQVVQKTVGYYETCSKFNSKFKNYFNVNSNLVVSCNTDAIDFDNLLKSVTRHECLLMQQTFLPKRKSVGDLNRKSAVSITHVFNTFQSCLFHIIQINALLNFPLQNLKISDFYSGTLLFNLFCGMKKSPSCDIFCDKTLKPVPNIERLHAYLCNNLKKYFPVQGVTKSKKSATKKKKKKKSPCLNELIICEYKSDDDDDYSDSENPFTVLNALTR